MINATLVAHSPNSGGAGRMLSHLAIGLAKTRTVKPTVILGQDERESRSELSGYSIPCFNGPYGNAYFAQESQTFPTFARTSLDNAARYIELFYKSRSDIVLVNTLTNYDAVIAARMAMLPYVVWLHGVVDGSFNNFDDLKPVLDASVLRNAAGLICCSDWTRDYFANLVEDQTKLITIPNWTEVHEAASLTSPDKPLQLCLLGSLEDHKSIDTAIWAIALLKKGGTEVCLNVYGDGHNKSQLQELARSLKVADLVTFKGKTSDTRSVYKSSFATLITSTSEAFGMTAIESMAVGTLVIASKAGGLPSVVDDGVSGLLYETKDPSDLAKKISYAIEHPADAQKLAASGYERAAEHFDGRKSIASFEDRLQGWASSFRGYPADSDVDIDYLRIASKIYAPAANYIHQHTLNLERQIELMKSSRSWRWSAPIRMAGRLLRPSKK